MLHSLAKRIAFFLFGAGEYPIEVYIYGLELIISSLIGESIVLILGLILGRLIETIIFIVLIKFIRIYSGGFHAKTYIVCNIVFIISYSVSLFVSRCLANISPDIIFIIMIATILVTVLAMAIMAPIENVNKPISLERRKVLKIKAIVAALTTGFIFMTGYLLYRLQEMIIIIPGYLTIVISMLAEIGIYGKEKDYEEDSKRNIGESGCKDS